MSDKEVSRPEATVRRIPGSDVTVAWGRYYGKDAVRLTFHADQSEGEIVITLTRSLAVDLARQLLDAASAL